MDNATVSDAATRLVSLAKGDLSLPDGEWEPVVLAVLRDAGFGVTSVVKKKAVGHYRDQDGSRTGETYPLNAATGIDAPEHAGATVWLNGVWGNVRRRERDDAASWLAAEIVRSRPLPPIALTAIGETLREYPPQDVFGTHARDADSLGSCVGVHDVCGGWMDRKRVSATYDALVCRSCHLRVTIPNGIATYGDLRAYFAELQPK